MENEISKRVATFISNFWDSKFVQYNLEEICPVVSLCQHVVVMIQAEAMGLDRETLDQINRKAIHLNIQARRGENLHSESGMWPGYDPALQGKTGISFRFGPPDCPTLHGVASCVDYCTAYMGAWAGVTALYQREARGTSGLSAGASLAMVSTLMQFTHLGDGE